MSPAKLGDLDLKDYFRIVGRTRRWRRTRAVVLAGTFFVAFVAGKYGPWPGTDSRDLTLDEATAILVRPEEAGYEHKLAVLALYRRVEEAVIQMGKVMDRSDEVGMQASMAIGAIATRAVRLATSAAKPQHAAIHGDTIRRIQALLPK
jgi:hypothetical protein